MTGTVLPLAVLAALASGAVACSSTPGNPVPSEESSTPTSGSERPTRSTSTSRADSGTGPLTGIDPCSLLPESAASQLGLGQGASRDILGSPACRWVVSGSHTTDVVIFDDLGLKDLVATGGRQDLPPIGGRQAVQSFGAGGNTCAITLDVTESSRVDVQTTAGTDKDKACEVSLQVARLVEPQLP